MRLPLYAFTRSTSVVTGTPLTTYQRGQLLESDLPWFHTPRVAQSVPRPRGYVVLPGWPQIERALRAHGLRIEPLPGDLDARGRDPAPVRAAIRGPAVSGDDGGHLGAGQAGPGDASPPGGLPVGARRPAGLRGGGAAARGRRAGLAAGLGPRSPRCSSVRSGSTGRSSRPWHGRAERPEAGRRLGGRPARSRLRGRPGCALGVVGSADALLGRDHRPAAGVPSAATAAGRGRVLGGRLPATGRARARVAGARRRRRAHAATRRSTGSPRQRRAPEAGLDLPHGRRRADGRSQIQCNPIVVDGVLYATSPGAARVRARRRDAASELWRFDPSRPGRSAAGSASTAVSSTGSDGDASGASSSAPGRRLYALDARDRPARPRLRARAARRPRARGSAATCARAYVRGDHARRRLPRPAHPRQRGSAEGPARPRRATCAPSTSARARCAGRFHTIPQPGEFGYETLAARRVEARGRRQLLGGHEPRPRARDRLRADRLGRLRLLGRRPQRRQPLRQLAARARRGDRRARAGTTSSCTTTSGTATCPRRPSSSTCGATAARSTRWRRPPSRATSSCSTATPASRCSRSRSAPCRRLEPRGRERVADAAAARTPAAFARQAFDEKTIATDISPEARAAVLERLRQVRSAGQFVPPSTQGTVIFPGFDGGAEWGGAAFDPETRPALRQRQRDAVDPRDGARCRSARHGSRRAARALRPALRRLPRLARARALPGPVSAARRARDAPGARRDTRDGREGQGRHARLRVPLARRARRGRVLRPRRARARRRRDGEAARAGRPYAHPATTVSSTPRATPR